MMADIYLFKDNSKMNNVFKIWGGTQSSEGCKYTYLDQNMICASIS